MYVFDTGAFIHLFKFYYTETFESLWKKFDELVKDGKIISVMEVRRELENHGDDLAEWVKNHTEIFLKPNQDEVNVVAHIYSNLNFEHNIKKQDKMQYCNEADPFVVAKAKVLGYKVESTEVYKNGGAKVPNLCEYEGVQHLSVQDFMNEENWKF